MFNGRILITLMQCTVTVNNGFQNGYVKYDYYILCMFNGRILIILVQCTITFNGLSLGDIFMFLSPSLLPPPLSQVVPGV